MTSQHGSDVVVSDAGIPDASAPDAAVVTTTTDVEVVVNDHAAHTRWAIAVPGETISLVLTSKPVACKDYRWIVPPLDGARMRAEIPPGPGGRFFAGDPFGVNLIVENSDSNEPVNPALPIANNLLTISAPFVTLELEPFAYKTGEHIHGKIEGGEHMLIGSASVNGSFDAEICADPEPIKDPLPSSAPAHAVGGTIGARTVAPKTVHAIVRASSASQDEAVDVTIKRRPRGSLDYVWTLVFYAKPNVPCPTDDQDYAKTHLFRIQGPSGGAAHRPLLRTPQPASLIIPKGGNDYADIWEGTWVLFDALNFKTGDKIRGAVVSRPGHYSDERGQIAGHFEAVVCPL